MWVGRGTFFVKISKVVAIILSKNKFFLNFPPINSKEKYFCWDSPTPRLVLPVHISLENMTKNYPACNWKKCRRCPAALSSQRQENWGTFFSFICKFRMYQVQSHKWVKVSLYIKNTQIFSYIWGSRYSYLQNFPLFYMHCETFYSLTGYNCWNIFFHVAKR